MNQLPIFLNLAGKPVLLVGEGDAADAKRRLIVAAGGVPVAALSPDVRIAIVAIEDDSAAAVAVELRAAGLLVNVVDRPALCDFTTPAIIDRDPVVIAIGTGGASAGLAKALRQRLEALLPSGLGGLASALAAARARLRARWPDAGARRRAIDAALLPEGALDPFAAHDARDVAAWLASDTASSVSGLIDLVIAGDDPDDLTLRAARLLGQADVVHYHPDIRPNILRRARADAVRKPGAMRPDDTVVGAGELHLWLMPANITES